MRDIHTYSHCMPMSLKHDAHLFLWKLLSGAGQHQGQKCFRVKPSHVLLHDVTDVEIFSFSSIVSTVA